jgi:hypothetical protein
MNKIYVIYWEEKYSDGSFTAGVLPSYYTSFAKVYVAMHKAWEADKKELMDNGMLESSIRNLTSTTATSITYDNYDEWTKYEIKELEME